LSDNIAYARPDLTQEHVERAAEEIQRMAGTQFDPEVCRVFAGLVETLPQRV